MCVCVCVYAYVCSQFVRGFFVIVSHIFLRKKIEAWLPGFIIDRNTDT